MKRLHWLLVLAAFLSLAAVLGVFAACTGDDDDDDDDDDAGDDDTGDDDTGDDDTGDDDDDTEPEPFCELEQDCWTALTEDLDGADSEGAFNLAVNDFYVCLDAADGCTGQHLDCIEDCEGDAECLQQCDDDHFACLDESCGWNSYCYSSCADAYAICIEACGAEDWECKRDCFAVYADCIPDCW